MLHSTLPRAFLAPGLSYLGYYGEEVHHPYSTWHIPMEDPPAYPRLPEVSQPWEAPRSATPCPLDLSLKPPPTPSTPRTEDAIEVDDEEDRRMREETQRRQRFQREAEEGSPPVIVDDSYERMVLKRESLQFQDAPEKSRPAEETRLYSGEVTPKYLPNPKLLSSPTSIGYHQQLLLTPQHHLQGIHAPMTPPSTPSPPQCPRRRTREEDLTSPASSSTPKQSQEKPSRAKKKHARRLKFDEDTSSPVSGTVILGPDEAVVTGDIDPAFNIVEVTEEARAELAKIENRLGPYQCKLCRQLHEDAFQLAQHRCSRIAHVEYRCPECDKRFSCPANLASHRRWHKPRLPNAENAGNSGATEIPCTRCEAKFTRQAALRKHLASQHPENNNNLLEGQETMGSKDAGNTMDSEMP